MRGATAPAVIAGGAGGRYVVPARAPAPAGAAGLAAAMAAARALSGYPGFAAEAAGTGRDAALRDACASARTPFGAALAAEAASSRRIAVFGDYDVDGMCSAAAALIALTLAREAEGGAAGRGGWRERAARCGISLRVPERSDGYGLQPRNVEAMRADGTETVLAVDNGTNAVAALLRAEALRMRVLVVDHHPPEAAALALWRGAGPRRALNPLLPGPLADLLGRMGMAAEMCAAQVVDLAAAELHARLGVGDGERHGSVLAGIATVTDVMPLRSQNRDVVRSALRRMASGDCLPGVALMTGQHLVRQKVLDRVDGLCGDLAGALDAEYLGFQLGPRLNACGRTGHAAAGVDLLLSDAEGAWGLSDRIELLNGERKARERAALDAVAPLTAAAAGRPTALWDLVGDPGAGAAEAGAACLVMALEDSSAVIALVPGVIAVVASSTGDGGVAGLAAGRIAAALGAPTLFCGMAGDPAAPGGRVWAAGSGRVPQGSPLLAVEVGKVASRVFAGLGADARAGGHSAAFGASAWLPSGARPLAAAVRAVACRMAAGIAADVRALGPEGIAAAKGEGRGDAGTAEGICDASVAMADVGPGLLAAVEGIGPFGRGHPAPRIHVDLPACSAGAMGVNGSFTVEAGQGRAGVRVIGFGKDFPGGLEGLHKSGAAARMASEGCGAVGRLKASYYRFGGMRWGGPSAELVLDALVERCGRPADLGGGMRPDGAGGPPDAGRDGR